MNKSLYVESGIQNGGEIHFQLSKISNPLRGTPSGKMITDSDEISFVYLFEEKDGYLPVHFPKKVWPSMVELLKLEVDPRLSWEEGSTTLVGFREELMMLIFNIEGNNNYGERFSSVVEEVFAEILQSDL